MSRIHPSYCVSAHHPPPPPSVLTVWKRSSMSFQGTDGFTVFDQHGRLAFRVDNYTAKNCVPSGSLELLLMDGSGKPLLTLKPQILSMQQKWNGYIGELKHAVNPRPILFTMARSSTLLCTSSACEAQVYMRNGTTGTANRTPDFKVEGSYRRRNCNIMCASGEVVAKISRKTVNKTIQLSNDIFTLQVEPGFETQLIMAIVIILDRITGKPFIPALCS